MKSILKKIMALLALHFILALGFAASASATGRCEVSGQDAQILQELVLGEDADQAYQYLVESLELTGDCLNQWLEWLGLNQWLEKEKLNLAPERQREGE